MVTGGMWELEGLRAREGGEGGWGGVSQELAFGISASAGGARVVRTCGSGTSDLLAVR